MNSKFLLLLCSSVAGTAPVPLGGVWYVSASATNGSGSLADPWTLTQACNSLLIQPGDTVYLRAGVYSARPAALFFPNGTAGQPITIRPYPGESVHENKLTHVQIDGGIEARGTYVTVRDLHVYNTFSPRHSDQPTQNPPDITLTNGIESQAVGYRMINNVVHDVRHGIGAWSPVSGDIYGNLVYNTGFTSSDTGDGHAIYTQSLGGVKRLAANAIVAGFTAYGFHAYSSQPKLEHFLFEKNVQLGGAWILQGPPAVAPVFRQNRTYQCSMLLGNETPGAAPVVEDNYFTRLDGQVLMVYVGDAFTCQRNTFLGYSRLLWLYQDTGFNLPACAWDNNAYYFPYNPEVAFFSVGGATESFASWQAHYAPVDAHSTFSGATPTGVQVFAEPNEYDPDLGLLAVYNWDGLDSVAVDLTALHLALGVTYRLCQIADYLNDLTTFVYDGSPLALDMRAASHSRAVPINWAVPLNANSFPTFGAFIVERVV